MGAREERFSRLFEAAYQPLTAYARRRIAPDEVDDLVAEVLTVAWRKLDEVPAGDAALPWLYAVAYRTAGNVYRSRRRRLLLIDRLASVTSGSLMPRQEGMDPDVHIALGRLRPEDQEILRLAAWEDLQPAEIATVLGCSANAAAIRLSRARQHLRDQLKGSGLSRKHDPRRQIDA